MKESEKEHKLLYTISLITTIIAMVAIIMAHNAKTICEATIP